jgi:hypothetical protein
MPLKVKSWVIEANRLKGPTHLPLWSLQNSSSKVTGPIFSPDELGPLDNDLILNYASRGRPRRTPAARAGSPRPVLAGGMSLPMGRGRMR